MALPLTDSKQFFQNVQIIPQEDNIFIDYLIETRSKITVNYGNQLVIFRLYFLMEAHYQKLLKKRVEKKNKKISGKVKLEELKRFDEICL